MELNTLPEKSILKYRLDKALIEEANLIESTKNEITNEFIRIKQKMISSQLAALNLRLPHVITFTKIEYENEYNEFEQNQIGLSIIPILVMIIIFVFSVLKIKK